MHSWISPLMLLFRLQLRWNARWGGGGWRSLAWTAWGPAITRTCVTWAPSCPLIHAPTPSPGLDSPAAVPSPGASIRWREECSASPPLLATFPPGWSRVITTSMGQLRRVASRSDATTSMSQSPTKPQPIPAPPFMWKMWQTFELIYLIVAHSFSYFILFFIF